MGERRIMSEKKTGLSVFTQRQQEPEISSPPKRRKRGQGEYVSITVRLTRAQWERLTQFAMSEGDSLQGLALRGFSSLLKEKGLKDI
jgi:hypothetical protein